MSGRLHGLLWAVVLAAWIGSAQASPVKAKLDRTSAVVGETVTLVLETNDPDQSLETDLAVLDADFDVLNQRSETQMSYVNGRQNASVRLVVTLEPKRAGDLHIPALKFPGVTTQPLVLKVSPPPALAPGEAEPVFIEVSVLPETGPYYVLSQVSLMVRIFYQANLTEAAINPPSPEQASVRLLDEVPYQSERNGERYRVLERRYAIFPERSGTLTIPPMQLSGRLIERPSDRLWQPAVRGRRVRVESEPLSLEISPKPDGYRGDFWLPARRITLSQQFANSEELHVGEPVTRTVIVDAVGLEENMLEEPLWPDMPATRVYPDQPQGISRDDGEWVLGHKEFRYAVVPEQAGELILPEIRLDWWDTVADVQRTAVLPEYRIEVLPSELSKSISAQPLPGPAAVESLAVPAQGTATSSSVRWWQAGTGAFALLWLATLYFHFRRRAALTPAEALNGNTSPDEKELLKRFQQACHENDATTARKAFAQWIRHYAPRPLHGSMRDLGTACGDTALASAIAELDACGFTPDGEAAWKGDPLWAAFRRWRRKAARPAKNGLGERPELYAG
ncbi:MAG: BatD family protein [Lysobacterales bacterium]